MAGEPQNGVRFGVELEFIVQSSLPNDLTITHNMDHANNRKSVALQLGRITGLPFACQCKHGFFDNFCSICIDVPNDLRLPSGCVIWPPRAIHGSWSQAQYHYYYVQWESLLSENVEENRATRKGMEISTPIYDNNALTAGLPQLTQVVKALPCVDRKIICDSTCGLHVHVGLKQGMTLLLAKKMVTLVMLLERCLIQPLLPASRAGSMWALLICDHAYLNQQGNSCLTAADLIKQLPDFRVHVPLTPTDMEPGGWNNHHPEKFFKDLLSMWRTENLDALRAGLLRNSIAKLGFVLCARTAPDTSKLEGSPSTFEFRYPQMNFDMPFIRRWVEIFCRLGTIANLDAVPYRRMLSVIVAVLNQLSTTRTPPWELLLRALGLGHQVPGWQDQVRKHHSGINVSHVDRDGVLQPQE
ncbi:hypothetical protein S40285_06713 [Stachybotrys chlorohalonatus IBT 40285]|uniref:Amidoligase enzyme n=1 Tax=Stachybotrys chlorohalonatus (strain IBT 40285) TaxID=1283841 RepID=A0A084QTH5_STAC4|nr:hypothetical protein S40285_06713 [Stachybotrys chlorohalonata IBT 40285]